MLSPVALWLIGVYQRHLSPRKGYACAYRVLHGGTGCSGFAKQAIGSHGTIRALPLIRARFAGCRDAAVSLRKEKESKKIKDDGKSSERKYDWCAVDPCTPCPGQGCGALPKKVVPECDLPCDCGG